MIVASDVSEEPLVMDLIVAFGRCIVPREIHMHRCGALHRR